MDQLQFIVEYAAFDQHVILAAADPVQQFHDQPRHIVGQRPEMQDVAMPARHACRPRTEAAGFLQQAAGQNAVGKEQIVHGIRIQGLHPFINFIGVFDFCNVPGRSDDLPAVQDGCNLLQAQGVLLNGQGGMDRPDAVGTAQRGHCGQRLRSRRMADQFGNFGNLLQNGVRNFKRRVPVVHGCHLASIITVHRSFHPSFCMDEMSDETFAASGPPRAGRLRRMGRPGAPICRAVWAAGPALRSAPARPLPGPGR